MYISLVFLKVRMARTHNKTLENCIVTTVYLDSLPSLFSFKYCYGIRMDQLNMNNIKHLEKINTHTQITKTNTIQRSGLLFFFFFFFFENAICAAV